MAWPKGKKKTKAQIAAAIAGRQQSKSLTTTMPTPAPTEHVITPHDLEIAALIGEVLGLCKAHSCRTGQPLSAVAAAVGSFLCPPTRGRALGAAHPLSAL